MTARAEANAHPAGAAAAAPAAPAPDNAAANVHMQIARHRPCILAGDAFFVFS